MTSGGKVEPGWYDDPVGKAHKRWFDGQGWTNGILDREGRTAVESPAIDPQPVRTPPVVTTTATPTPAVLQATVVPDATSATPASLPGWAATPRPAQRTAYPWWWAVAAVAVAVPLLATTWDDQYTWGAACFLVGAGLAMSRSGNALLAGIAGAVALAVGMLTRPLQFVALGGELDLDHPGMPLITLVDIAESGRTTAAVAVGIGGIALIVLVGVLAGPRRGSGVLAAVGGLGVGSLGMLVLERATESYNELRIPLGVGSMLGASALAAVLIGLSRPTPVASPQG